MTKEDNEALLAKIDELKGKHAELTEFNSGYKNALIDVLSVLNELPKELKFKVGDVIRKINAGAYDTKMIVVLIEKDYYLCDNIGKYSSRMVSIAEQDNYELVKESESKERDDALEKEIEAYLQKSSFSDYGYNVARLAAKHFADWQRQHDRLEVAKAQAKIWQNGFKDGKQWLMKDAMDGRVINDDGDYKLIVPALPVVMRELDEDDKVKVIVITDNE